MRLIYKLSLWIGILLVQPIAAQNLRPTQISLPEAESIFLKNNLTLLAAHYNIDASKALTIQARIWDNPTFSADLNAYNPENNKYFDVGYNGEKAFAIQQIIYLGGKKRNEARLAKSNEEIAELQFSDLLRSLKLQLRRSFYTLYFNSKNIENSDKQIAHIEELVNSYTVQAQKGNIALKEVVRLQSLFLNLKNERNEIVNSSIEEQDNLKLLLGQSDDISPKITDADIAKYAVNTVLDIKTLEDKAIANRPDYLQKQKAIESNEWNVKWQKSQSIPDITLGAAFDQRSGAFNNQVDALIGIPLPLWNKNKGNIKYAKLVQG